jgi:hypothetical protein
MGKQTFKFVFTNTLVWFCFFCGTGIRCQSYIKLINNYSEWHVTTCNSGCITDKYYTIGDTLINNLHYSFLDLYHYNKNFVIREDTLDRKVYMRLLSLPPSSKEFLLYDFSLQVSDTISILNPGSPYPSQAGEFILDSIVSKPLLTQNHRYFYFHALDTVMANTKHTVWVEGIGSLCLINTPGAMPQINGVGQLSCFFSNGIQRYQDLDSIASCSMIYPIGLEEHPSPPSFRIRQNFETKTLVLQMDVFTVPYTLELYAIDGRRTLRLENIDSTSYILNLNSFSEGFLVLKITDRYGRSSSHKVLNF